MRELIGTRFDAVVESSMRWALLEIVPFHKYPKWLKRTLVVSSPIAAPIYVFAWVVPIGVGMLFCAIPAIVLDMWEMASKEPPNPS